MICPNCKKQIPDDSNECGYCGAQINHKEQVSQEISYRRYQRWFFYVLISLIVLGMVAATVWMYNTYSKNLSELATVEERLKTKKEELSKKEEDLSQKQEKLRETKSELSQKEKELQQKTGKLQESLDEKAQIEEKYQDCNMDLNQADSHIYSLIVKLGDGVSNEKLNQIPLGGINIKGEDQDGDGLSDMVEESLPTSQTKADTDDDGYSDKEELLKGFNPVGEGKLQPDPEFVKKHKGDILLQVEGNNEAWYLDSNGKRYFLGKPAEAFEVMKSVEYWDQSPTSTSETTTTTPSTTTPQE